MISPQYNNWADMEPWADHKWIKKGDHCSYGVTIGMDKEARWRDYQNQKTHPVRYLFAADGFYLSDLEDKMTVIDAPHNGVALDRNYWSQPGEGFVLSNVNNRYDGEHDTELIINKGIGMHPNVTGWCSVEWDIPDGMNFFHTDIGLQTTDHTSCEREPASQFMIELYRDGQWVQEFHEPKLEATVLWALRDEVKYLEPIELKGAEKIRLKTATVSDRWECAHACWLWCYLYK
jgi:hypothetical protein